MINSILMTRDFISRASGANPVNRNTELNTLIKNGDKKDENNQNSTIENSGNFKSTLLFNFQASSTIMPSENKGYSLDDVITAAGGFGRF